MAINVSEAVQLIKKAGPHRTRIVPASGQSVVDGNHQIEIRESNDQWTVIVAGVKKGMAESIVAQAANNVILG